jgi:hypothetical protein
MTAKHDFKHQARQPADRFEKLLEATCPNHAYPVKQKLKECTMMKNYMTSGALAKGKKPEGDMGERPPHPSLGKRQSCQSTVGPSTTSPSLSSSLRAR